MAERSLRGMLTKETPAYRRHSVEQTLGRLKEDKRDFRSKLDEWQIRLNWCCPQFHTSRHSIIRPNLFR